MNLRYEIADLYEGPNAVIYTVKTIDDEDSEFDKFQNDPENTADPHFQDILYRLINIADLHGCRDDFFKPESTRDKAIFALYHSDSDLRLYCIKYRLTLLIVGCGGVKSTRTYQEDPHLNHCVETLEDFWERFDPLVRSGEIEIDSKGRLSGPRKI